MRVTFKMLQELAEDTNAYEGLAGDDEARFKVTYADARIGGVNVWIGKSTVAHGLSNSEAQAYFNAVMLGVSRERSRVATGKTHRYSFAALPIKQ